MIDKKELRIGNFVYAATDENDNPEIVVITQLHHKELMWRSLSNTSSEGPNATSYEYVDTIPITPELLEKAAFEKHEYRAFTLFDKYVGEDGFVLRLKIEKSEQKYLLVGNGGYDESGEMDISATCKYLHQLQNIYHSLTGEELTINL